MQLRTAAAVVLLAAMPGCAFAQQVDSRLAPAAIAVLKAQTDYLQQALALTQADAERREREWAAYSAPLWQAPEPAAAK